MEYAMQQLNCPYQKCRRLTTAVMLLALSAAGSAGAGTLADGRLDYGTEGLPIPPVPLFNETTPRTAQLLADAAGRAVTSRDAVRYVRELASCELPVAIEPLKGFLGDRRPEVRAQAAAGFATLGRSRFETLKLRPTLATDKGLMGALEKLAADPDANCRAEALEAVVVITEGASPVLEQALKKPSDAAVFRRALSLATQPSHAAAIAGVWPELDDSIRLLAAESLGRCGDSRHTALVTSLLKGSIAQKVAALHALAGMKQGRETVEPLLADASASVRREAMLALRSLANADGNRAAALRLIKDPDPTVRQAAVTVLGQFVVPSVLETIASQLGDEYQPLYDAATRALSTQTDPAVRQAAIDLSARLLEHENLRRRQDASFILGAYRADAALEKHIAIVDAATADKPDWLLIAQACDSLGRIGRSEAKGAIAKVSHQVKKAMGAGDADYRSAVAKALISSGRLGDATVLQDAVSAANGSPMTTPSEIRAAGIFAVGMLGSPSNAGLMPRVITGEMDPMDAKIEAIKAIGNLKAKGQLGALKRDNMLSVEMLWLAHWAKVRTTGEDSPFVAEPQGWRPDVSITDATPKE